VSLALADPFESLDQSASEARTARNRWQVWRSPDDQPRWARPALLGVAVVAAVLYAWNLSTVDMSPYYSAAVKSMSESWKAFLYGAFDPQATITIDKLAGSFMPQALSARIFGFQPWAVAFPQVIEGIVAVLVMYRVVRRWAGPMPGIFAAGIFAITPIAASMFGHSMEDGALTMCMVLAADAYQRAVLDARLRPLLYSGIWVGLGFQCKMLQAWMILPALAVGYAVTAPAPLRRRMWHLGVAGAVTLAVSMSWILLFTFTPAADRPYVDGSTNNSAFTMVFGYNGLERFGINLPDEVGGRGPGGKGAGAGMNMPADAGLGGSGAPGASQPGPGQAFGTPGTSGFSGAEPSGWTKLFSSQYAPEIGWLFPLALLSLALGLVWRRRAERTDRVRGGLLMWGTWLLTAGVVLSDMSSLPHTAYLAELAPSIAALGGVGTVMLGRAYRAGGRRAWALPVTVVLELGWTVAVWSSYRDFLPWALWLSVAVGVVAIVALVIARFTSRTRARLMTTGVVAAVVAMLAAPTVWAASVLDPNYEGSSYDASAGPTDSPGGLGGSTSFAAAVEQRAGEQRGIGGRGPRGMPAGPSSRPGAMMTATTTLSAGEQRIYAYLLAHSDGATYLVSVSSWSEAEPFILATGQEVLTEGGFSGQVPEPTLGRVQELVNSGQLRFFLVLPGGLGMGMGGSGSATTTVTNWVEHSCAKVPPKDYGGATSAGATAASGALALLNGDFSSSKLYQCTPS
jgi:4-amino-4-deoxy-L-arabinose transferase-like glycosyltransferase